jgi:hyaluronate lyase
MRIARRFPAHIIKGPTTPAAGAVHIAPSTAATSAATCLVSAAQLITPAAAAASQATCLVTIPQPISPSSSAASAAAARVTIPQPITPAAGGASAATCFITAPAKISPSSNASSGATCLVSARTFLSASAAASSAAAAVVAVPQPFTAHASATSGASCTVTITFQVIQTGSPFRYPAWDAMTGNALDDLPYNGVQFGRIVNQPGPWVGALQLADKGVQRLDFRNASIPGRSLIAVEFMGSPVWFGMIWTRKYKRKGTQMIVGAQELGSWLNSRVQAADYTSIWQDGADPLVILSQIVTDALGVASLGPTINVATTPAISGGTGTSPTAQTYTKNGSYTYTVPAGTPAGTQCTIECWGAGGGGGGGGTAFADGGGGGAGGGYAIEVVTVNAGDTITVNVGKGGTGGNASSTGSTGGDSTATHSAVTVTGKGGPGGHGSNSTPNAGGTGLGGTGTTTYLGGNGGQGSNFGGAGGSSAGQSANGNAGGDGLHTYHAPGGAAPPGGGPGGNGDGGGGSGNTPTAGPGGGGGGGTGQARDRGGAGFDGQAAITVAGTGGGGSGSGQVVAVSYPLSQMQTIMSLINLLTQMGYSYGPDWTVDVAYSPGTRNPIITINFWYPRAGKYNPPAVSIDIANCTDFEYDEDATQQAWSVTEKGGGAGGLQPVTQQAPQVDAAGWPLMEGVFSRTQANTADVLANIAKGDLSLYAWPVTTPTVTVPVALPNAEGVLNPNALAFSQLTIGDDMQLVIDPVPLDAAGDPVYGINNDPRFPDGMNFTWRNTNWTCQVPPGGVPVFVLAMATPPSLSTNPTRPPA